MSIKRTGRYNDDVPAMEAEIERLTAENERLRALLKECADDLEIEIGHRYPLSSGDVPGRDVYPDMQRRFERDMAPVFAARRALDQQLTPHPNPPATESHEKSDKV